MGCGLEARHTFQRSSSAKMRGRCFLSVDLVTGNSLEQAADVCPDVSGGTGKKGAWMESGEAGKIGLMRWAETRDECFHCSMLGATRLE